MEGVETRGGREREGPCDEGRGAILVGRKCPLGKTGGASSRPRSDKTKKEPPCGIAAATLLRPRDSEFANKIQINSDRAY